MKVSQINYMIVNTNFKQRLALGLGLALLLAVSFTLIYSISQWRNDWVLAHQEITAKPTMAAADTANTLITAIPNTHLFGKSFSGNVPITNLQLRVTGIVKASTEQNGAISKAYISMSGQPSKIYQTGDNLPAGVKIYDITSDAVILENDGHLEKLPLPREKLQFKMRAAEENA